MAYMVNQEGVVTGHPDQSLALGQSSLAQLSGGNQDAVERVTTGETGAVEFPIDGEKMLVAFSPIRGTQWSIVIQIPKADYGHFINGYASVHPGHPGGFVGLYAVYFAVRPFYLETRQERDRPDGSPF